MLAVIAYLAIVVGASVLVMIHGWGLEPQSWWWIIGVGIFVTAMLHSLGRKLVKELNE